MESRSKRLNFSVLERDVLLRLIEANIEIVESKRNDGMTVRRKDAAWSRIVAGFNAEHNVVKRTHRQLRKYWNNLKMRAKKSMSSNGYSTLNLPTAGSVALRMGKSNSRSPGIPNKTPDGMVSNGACATTSGRMPSSSLGTVVVKSEPKDAWSYQEQQSQEGKDGAELCSPVPLTEGGQDDEEVDEHPGRSNGEVTDPEAEFEDVHDSDDEEIGEVFHCEGDSDYRHETAAGVMSDFDNPSSHHQWTAMDYARNEHEAKMALLTVQMETAHEQRELAREVREQTRQRHRLEMQVLEEKRRYRRIKMNALTPHGHSLVHGTHEPRALEPKQKTSLDKA
ncbi:uncharacterized protein LOC119723499 [Patiria miniata]|uniref:Myb/SANT-like DNA-binding domain-containing protein n=1 Tax=Patiria miniata TaxID=46514 RepID=A0A913ZF75_PATMI|nr:uncharacterized protein LOC119723499 [Patiria miniata]